MKAAIFKGKEHVEVGQRPNPRLQEDTDALVRVVRGCVCGSDLWYYRGISEHPEGSIGHEFIGVIEEVGSKVASFTKGDLVIAPFLYMDDTDAHWILFDKGVCIECLHANRSDCSHGGAFGDGKNDGGQGEIVRVPFAEATLVKVPEGDYSEDMLASLLTLSDVMCTGYHAAISAEVKQGDTVVVVGDGAVGLCAVIAAKLRGASRIIALSRHEPRQKLAREFGATEIVAERGEAAVAKVLELTGGVSVDAALECVGTEDALATAFGVVKPGALIGVVGLPIYGMVNYSEFFFKNVGLRGGPAPVRKYIPELLGPVLEGRIDPGKVFDFQTDLDHISEAYAAMDERRAIKSLLNVSSV